ncbi:MAG: hypothetical protein LBP99_01525 [Azoarcus sp.]|nr:hypothetical protein [Azoarcus sp.]
MYTDADVARTEAVARLNRLQQEGALPLTQQVFESAQKDLQAQLAEMGANPDKIIHDLLDKSKVEAELTTEKKRVQELGAQLAGLTEAKKVLTRASRTPVLDGASVEALASALELRARLEQEFLVMSDQNVAKLTDSEIASRALAAVNFKRNIETLVERELGLPLIPGQEPVWGRWLLTDSNLFKSTLNGLTTSGAGNGNTPRMAGNENNNTLLAQVSFLRARLETLGDKTAPPCWFDDDGRVQFLLTIELLPRTSNNVTVKSAWPPARETSAMAIPGIKQLLATRGQTYASFKDRARSIARHSGQQCRYSVQVIDNLGNGMRSEAIHKELETFFHLVSLPH